MNPCILNEIWFVHSHVLNRSSQHDKRCQPNCRNKRGMQPCPSSASPMGAQGELHSIRLRRPCGAIERVLTETIQLPPQRRGKHVRQINQVYVQVHIQRTRPGSGGLRHRCSPCAGRRDPSLRGRTVRIQHGGSVADFRVPLPWQGSKGETAAYSPPRRASCRRPGRHGARSRRWLGRGDAAHQVVRVCRERTAPMGARTCRQCRCRNAESAGGHLSRSAHRRLHGCSLTYFYLCLVGSCTSTDKTCRIMYMICFSGFKWI